MRNVIFCIDHAIGFNVINYILNKKNDFFKVSAIYTTLSNDKGFWEPIKNIESVINVRFFTNNAQLLEEIENDDIDLVFLISWKYLISDKIIEKINIGIINLHYSLLPKYRGVYPVNNAIINGEKETGVTYHWIDKDIDSGHIIQQVKIPIKIDDTASSLLEKLDTLALDEFKKIWERKIKLIFKDDMPKEKKNIYHSRNGFESTNELDLSKEYKTLDLLNLIRGKTFKGNSQLYIKDENGRKIFISLKFIVE